MGQTEELAQQVQAEWPQLRCSALVLNAQGLDRALRCGLRHLSLSVSMSDTHSRANAGCAAGEALDRMAGLVRTAVDRGITVRAGVQCAFGCVDEGQIPQEHVMKAARRLTAAGATEINLADTAGMADPLRIKQLAAAVRQAVPEAALSLHLHDAKGQGPANMSAGYDAGVRLFDVSVGGLGGCPFIRGPVGNVAAEDAVRLFAQRGEETGIDLDRLVRVTKYYEELLGRELLGKREQRRRPAEG